MKFLQVVICSICISLSHSLTGRIPEQGIFDLQLTSEKPIDYVVKSLYNLSSISITINTNFKECTYDKTFYLQWLIVGTPCKGRYKGLESETGTRFIFNCLHDPMQCSLQPGDVYLYNYDTPDTTGKGNGIEVKCKQIANIKMLKSWEQMEVQPTELPPDETTLEKLPSPSSRRRRALVPGEETDDANQPNADNETANKAGSDDDNPDADGNDSAVADNTAGGDKPEAGETQPDQAGGTSDTGDEKGGAESTKKVEAVTSSAVTIKNQIAEMPLTAEYMVIAIIKTDDDELPKNMNFPVQIAMKTPVGYLSADEHPLLVFYMIMCIIYVFYALAWLVMSACNYHDLLRVQFWIGGVILLGMIEKAVHYSEYLNVNTTGISQAGMEKFAEIVSAFKRAVARMLVIIVSLGFGIVKPRLGPMLHRVIALGVIYFILAVLEAMVRIDHYFHPTSREAWMFMYIPLAVIDSITCWWVFMSLLQTMKTLRLRRNTTKLALYRHFSNVIIFCVLVAIILMIWSIHSREVDCEDNIQNLWFDTACWPILFSIILLVIMILWRPNANNQRYAYSPMIDGNDSDDDEMEEPMLGSGATENMKMRSSKKSVYVKSDVDRTEEDLKWIEENIPQTVADAALPALLDSDEEVMTTKYEMSKME